MRRRLLPVLATAAIVLGVAGCNGGGGISLPTLPSVSLPTVTLPTVTLPTVTLPTITLPTNSDTTPPKTSTSEQQGTVTVTTTERRTETETSTVTQTATPAPQPVPTSSGLPAWLWILLVILLVAIIVLIVWLVRRSQAKAAWDEKMHAARREAGWVEDSLVEQVNSRATTAEAAATWVAARPRLLALDESIYSLSTTAPDPERAATATRLRGRLQALVDAVSADTATGDAASVDDLRVRRAAVSKARSDLRGLLEAAKAKQPR